MASAGYRPMVERRHAGDARFAGRPAWLTRSRALAAVLLFLALVAFAYALWPPGAATPRAADAAVGVLMVAVATVLLLVGERLPMSLSLDVPVVLAWGCVAFMAATRPTPQGQVLFGYPLVLIGGVIAFFLPWRRAMAHVVAMLMAFLVAIIIVGEHAALFYLFIAGMTVVVTSGTIFRLRSDRDRLLADAARRALLDPLTGALNRRGLDVEVPVVRSLTERSGQLMSVVAIDLDGFKQFNDEQGHAAGDRLLQDVVREWRQMLREGDLLARVGGDEFVFVLAATAPDAAARLLQRMRTTSCAQWSVGIADWRLDEDFLAVLDRADAAMYADKAARGGSR